MPLLIREKINDKASWALWEITEDENTLLTLLQPGPQEEQELGSVKNLYRRLEWLASRLVIKDLAISHGVNKPEIVKDSCGKPFLPGSDLHISLSHSFPYAAAIIDSGKETGIDIEKSRDQLCKIRHKFLNPEEETATGNKPDFLCVYWTAKEAVYKIYGKSGIIFRENIFIRPFCLKESGTLEAVLAVKDVKEYYTLHYRRFREIHVCYSL